jgi:hypothetical protein
LQTLASGVSRSWSDARPRSRTDWTILARLFPHADDPDADISLRALTAAGELACEESVAVAVFRARLANARDPMAREVVEIILRDEANHRAFAWDLIDELIGLLGHARARAWTQPRVAWWLRVYLRARLEQQVERYTPAQLGLLDSTATVDSLTAELQALTRNASPTSRSCWPARSAAVGPSRTTRAGTTPAT